MTSTDCDLLFPCNQVVQVGGCWLALVQLLSKDTQKPGSPLLRSVTYIPLTVRFLTYHLMIPIWPLQEAWKSSASAEGKIVNLAKDFLPVCLTLSTESEYVFHTVSNNLSSHLRKQNWTPQSAPLHRNNKRMDKEDGIGSATKCHMEKNSMLYKMCHQFLIQIKINWYLK